MGLVRRHGVPEHRVDQHQSGHPVRALERKRQGQGRAQAVADETGAPGALGVEQVRQIVDPDAEVVMASRHRLAMPAQIDPDQVMARPQAGFAREFGPARHVAREPVQENDARPR